MRFASSALLADLRFVAFTNEETPFTRSVYMGSRIYARRCKERKEHIAAMVCLETIGCAFDEPGTQRLSLNGLLLPQEGNFIALVGNRRSKRLLHACRQWFEDDTDVPCEGITLPTNVRGA